MKNHPQKVRFPVNSVTQEVRFPIYLRVEALDRRVVMKAANVAVTK